MAVQAVPLDRRDSSSTSAPARAHTPPDFGADPFLRDAQGRSPLGVARMWDRRECVQVLEDWEKAALLRWLRNLQDAVDAHALAPETMQVGGWLGERARGGRALADFTVDHAWS